MGKLDDLLGKMGFEIEYEDEDEEKAPQSKRETQPDRQDASNKKSNRKNEEKSKPITLPSSSAMGQVVLIEPKKISDARIVSDEVKSGKTVVVHVEEMDIEDVTRLYDFITGAAYALNGKLKEISDNVLVIAPYNVDIQTAEEQKEETYSYDDNDLDYGY